MVGWIFLILGFYLFLCLFDCMEKIIFGIFFILYWGSLFGQKISFYDGRNAILTDQKVRMIGTKEDFSFEKGFWEAEIEIPLGKQISVACSYFEYEGNTKVAFPKGSVLLVNGLNVGKVGFSGIDIRRYNLISRYTFGRKFLFEPGLGFSYQKSIANEFEVGSLNVVNGPDYVATGTRSTTYTRSQIIPVAEIRLSYGFFNVLYLNFRVAGALGFKSHQDLYMDYTYKGVSQPTAVFQARGTGIFYTAGLSLDFGNLYRILFK